MIDARFRPLPTWPHPVTPSYQRRSWYTFKASWSNTLDLLDREIRTLNGSAVIIAAGFEERDIRLDGWPRADARSPVHPGVEISFDSRYGRLAYATDVCARWEHNVRSIALGLEALRAVDRYGVSSRGQQYAGWKALPGGGVIIASTEEAWTILKGFIDADPDDDSWELEELWRRVVKVVHPDVGGNDSDFIRASAAHDLLVGSA